MNNSPIRLGLIMSFLSLFLYGNAQLAPRLELTNPDEVLMLTNSTDCTAYIDLIASGIGFCDNLEITNDSPFGTGDHDASAEYPAGHYTIEFTATDDCNNEIVEEISFIVKDGEAPTASCIYGLAFNLSPMCELTFDASYIDYGSHDNCTGQSDLLLEIAKINDNGNYYERGASLSLECHDLGNLAVVLIVIDEAGNESYCNTVIQVQEGICNPVTCDSSECIEMVIPVLFPNGRGGFPFRLNELQLYANGEHMGEFRDQAWMCVDTDLASDWLIIEAEKEGDIKNGLDAMDLIILEGYFLNQWALTPYAKIAADVNNDHKVNILDWFEIKQVILNQRTKFSSNRPIWSFIDGEHMFDDDPWASEIPFYIEIIEPQRGELSNYEHSFVAVKSGDIDYDALPSRSNETLMINSDNTKFLKGEKISLSLEANNDGLKAYQFTIDFDPTVLEFINIEGAISSSDYNLDLVDQGIVTIVKIQKFNTYGFFEVNFKALTNSEMKAVVEINSSSTKAVAYNRENERLDVELNFLDITSENKILQNSPNPFSESTTISFNMEQAGVATLKVVDIAGRVVFENTNPAKQGYNEIELTKSDLGTTGVYYCHLTTGNSESTVKMILF